MPPSDTRQLRGLAAVVTGSSSGIGRSIALALAEEGASLVCADLTPEVSRAKGSKDERATHELVCESGSDALFVATNVTVASEVEECITRCTAAFGRLDIMVNNAGIWVGPRWITEETEEEFDRTLAVNCKGVWLGCKYAIAAMAESGSPGRIVNIGSIAGLVGLEREPAYCASKGAVIALTRQLALDYARYHINVNAICPGFVNTALSDLADGFDAQQKHTPWPTLGVPSDIAGAAVFLASPASRWITGCVLAVDGGFTAR